MQSGRIVSVKCRDDVIEIGIKGEIHVEVSTITKVCNGKSMLKGVN